MSEKSEISAFNELCQKRRLQPQYSLVQDGTGTKKPTFVFKVVIEVDGDGDEFSAYGKGRSKKKAKEMCAKNALTKWKKMNWSSKRNLTSKAAATTSHFKNNVGNMCLICLKRNLGSPILILKEDGPPHAKLFTAEYKVAGCTGVAVERTKKVAMENAAGAVIEQLSSMNKAGMPVNTNYVEPFPILVQFMIAFDFLRFLLVFSRKGAMFKKTSLKERAMALIASGAWKNNWQ